MKILKDLLRTVDLLHIWGEVNTSISGICYDSRKIKKNSLFVAISGFKSKGIDYLPEAIKKGARAVISELPFNNKFKDITWIQVRNIREALSQISADFFNNPSKDLYVIGVTGTNGKTTVVSLIDWILNQEEDTAKMGTLGMEHRPDSKMPGFFEKTSLTTPEAPDIFNFFDRLGQAACKNVVMEVSSVGLKMNRVRDIYFSQGLFTTFSGDHLDFHKTMLDYFESKLMLFKKLSSDGWAILNSDEQYSYSKIIEHLNCKYLTYGFSHHADIRPKIHSFSLDGIQATVMTPKGNIEVRSHLIGRVNLLNILAAISSALIKNIPLEKISRAIRLFKPVKGRLDFTYKNDFSVLIDYAHTDQALKSLLQSLKEIVQGRIILVFGAGGSRDKSKRPRMGQVTSKYADFIVVTSDNPRDEKPEHIIGDIIDGFESSFRDYEVEINREKAIQKALNLVEKDDLLVIAGKGHEDYQIFKDRVIHFDDYEVVRKILKEKKSKQIPDYPKKTFPRDSSGGFHA